MISLKPIVYISWVIGFVLATIFIPIVAEHHGPNAVLFLLLNLIANVISIVIYIIYAITKNKNLGFSSCLCSFVASGWYFTIYLANPTTGYPFPAVILMFIATVFIILDWIMGLKKSKETDSIKQESQISTEKLVCPFCNSEIIDKTSTFCNKCGSPLN